MTKDLIKWEWFSFPSKHEQTLSGLESQYGLIFHLLQDLLPHPDHYRNPTREESCDQIIDLTNRIKRFVFNLGPMKRKGTLHNGVKQNLLRERHSGGIIHCEDLIAWLTAKTAQAERKITLPESKPWKHRKAASQSIYAVKNVIRGLGVQHASCHDLNMKQQDLNKSCTSMNQQDLNMLWFHSTLWIFER